MTLKTILEPIEMMVRNANGELIPSPSVHIHDHLKVIQSGSEKNAAGGE